MCFHRSVRLLDRLGTSQRKMECEGIVIPILIARTDSAKLQLEPGGILAVAILEGRVGPVDGGGFRRHDAEATSSNYWWAVDFSGTVSDDGRLIPCAGSC